MRMVGYGRRKLKRLLWILALTQITRFVAKGLAAPRVGCAFRRFETRQVIAAGRA